MPPQALNLNRFVHPQGCKPAPIGKAAQPRYVRSCATNPRLPDSGVGRQLPQELGFSRAGGAHQESS